MLSSTRRAVRALSVTALLVGCGGVDPFEQDVSVVLTATTPAAAAGEQVSFRFEALGTALIGVILDYGDNVVDSVELFGVTQASGTRAHTFAAPGTFEVAATVEDAVMGPASDTALVTITP